MSSVKAAVIALAGATGVSFPSAATFYYNSRESIWDQIKDDALPINLEDKEWELLKTKSTSSEILKNQKITTTQDLRNWCSKTYSTEYRSIFTSKNKSLKSNAEEICVLRIKEKLGDKSLNTSDSSDESTYKTNLNSLKTHSITGKSKLEKELNDIKNEIQGEDSSNNKWEKLKNWCDEAYKRGFKGEQEELWKLADKFCKKNS